MATKPWVTLEVFANICTGLHSTSSTRPIPGQWKRGRKHPIWHTYPPQSRDCHVLLVEKVPHKRGSKQKVLRTSAFINKQVSSSCCCKDKLKSVQVVACETFEARMGLSKIPLWWVCQANSLPPPVKQGQNELPDWLSKTQGCIQITESNISWCRSSCLFFSAKPSL